LLAVVAVYVKYCRNYKATLSVSVAVESPHRSLLRALTQHLRSMLLPCQIALRVANVCCESEAVIIVPIQHAFIPNFRFKLPTAKHIDNIAHFASFGNDPQSLLDADSLVVFRRTVAQNTSCALRPRHCRTRETLFARKQFAPFVWSCQTKVIKMFGVICSFDAKGAVLVDT